MAALGLDHYNIRAPSPLLEALRDFYVATLGLTVGARPRFRTHGYWLYADGHPVLHLSGTRPGEVREVGVVPTFDHVAFRCEDAIAMCARLDAAGVDYAVEDSIERAQRQVFLRDPAGNGIELNFRLEANG